MIQDYIVVTNDNGTKVLIQQNSIFYITDNVDGKGTIIIRIVARYSHLTVQE